MTEVRFTGVTKAYGAIKAIDDVTMSVRSGEFATVLGPSGSGKTTMLSLIAGISRPTSGRIDLGDREITNVPAASRNVGLVFQSYALFPHMSIFDNVAFPLRVRKIGSARLRDMVMEALRLVRLDGLEKRRPHQLSGGQQQRVALAPRHRFRARDPAAGRTAGRPRPQAARGGAVRDPRAAAQARHHHDHGHPRPGGSPVAVRPGRAAVARQGRPGRYTGRDLSPAEDSVRGRFPRPREFRRRNLCRRPHHGRIGPALCLRTARGAGRRDRLRPCCDRRTFRSTRATAFSRV